MNSLNRISGFGNSRNQQFYQTTATGAVQTYNFYAFTPVNGNVTFNALNEQRTSSAVVDVKTAYNVSGTYYDGITYWGRFASFNLATGEIVVHLGDQ